MISNLWRNFYISANIVAFTHVTFIIIVILHSANIFKDTSTIGYLMLANTLPFLITGPLLAQIVNKFNRKKIMIITSFIDVLINIFFFIMILNKVESISLYLLLISLNNLSTSLFQINESSYLPTILKDTELARYNSSIFFVGSIASIVSPYISTLFNDKKIIIYSILLLIIAQIFCFINSFYIKDGSLKQNISQHDEKISLIDSFIYTFKSKGLLLALLILAIGNFFDAPMDTILIGKFTEEGHIIFAGSILSAAGVGSLIGSFLIGLVSQNNSKLTRVMHISSFCIVLSGIGLFFENNYIYILVNVLLATGLSIRTIYIITYRQTQTPKHILGSVNTMFKYVAFGISPISIWIFTQMSKFLSNNILLIICGIGFIIVGITALYATKSDGSLILKEG